MQHERIALRAFKDRISFTGDVISGFRVGKGETVGDILMVLILLSGCTYPARKAMIEPHETTAGDMRQHAVEDALALDPGNALARYALGLARHRLGDTAGAVEALGQAAASAPHDPRLVLGHALALSSAGRGEAALEMLEAAIERGADDPEIHHARITLRRDRLGTAAAQAAAGEFLARFPNDPRARAVAREYGVLR